MSKTRGIVVVVCVCLAIVLLPVTQAGTITVTNTNDSGPGSLRQAIADALPGDEIVFDPSLDGLPIALTSGHLVIDKDLGITGRGAANTILDGDANSRVFYIFAATVSIFGLTVTNGDASHGGGILNSGGTLTLSETAISGNTAGYGGGILSQWGALTIADSTISGNSAVHWGWESRGDGIFSNAEFLTVRNSTVSGNSAGFMGGGIFSSADVLTVRNSTVSGNSASGLSGGSGMCVVSAIDASIVQSTIGRNRVWVSAGILTLSDSIVASCHGSGLFVSLGYNLGSSSCNLDQPTDLPNTNPMLGPLTDNGGPTWTHALLAGSPAIDAGSCPGGGNDQRGMPCPVDVPDVPNTDDGCDIGAFEFGCHEGSITAPTAGTCTADAVTVEDSYAELCDPALTRLYEPGPGPTYWGHGDYGVTLKVTDGVKIFGEDSVDFTIDTVSPVMEWIGLLSVPTLPTDLEFHSSDDDGATGEVVHEVMKLDECLVYDGATYGNHPNGLLSDDELVLSATELCRVFRECGFDTLVDPQIRVEGTDCAGNVGYDTHTFLGTLTLDTENCGQGAE